MHNVRVTAACKIPSHTQSTVFYWLDEVNRSIPEIICVLDIHALRVVASQSESRNWKSVLKKKICLMHSTYCARCCWMFARTRGRWVAWFIFLTGKFVLLFIFNHVSKPVQHNHVVIVRTYTNYLTFLLWCCSLCRGCKKVKPVLEWKRR